MSSFVFSNIHVDFVLGKLKSAFVELQLANKTANELFSNLGDHIFKEIQAYLIDAGR